MLAGHCLSNCFINWWTGFNWCLLRSSGGINHGLTRIYTYLLLRGVYVVARIRPRRLACEPQTTPAHPPPPVRRPPPTVGTRYIASAKYHKNFFAFFLRNTQMFIIFAIVINTTKYEQNSSWYSETARRWSAWLCQRVLYCQAIFQALPLLVLSSCQQ